MRDFTRARRRNNVSPDPANTSPDADDLSPNTTAPPDEEIIRVKSGTQIEFFLRFLGGTGAPTATVQVYERTIIGWVSYTSVSSVAPLSLLVEDDLWPGAELWVRLTSMTAGSTPVEIYYREDDI